MFQEADSSLVEDGPQIVASRGAVDVASCEAVDTHKKRKGQSTIRQEACACASCACEHNERALRTRIML